jgi:hypothetical protein
MTILITLTTAGVSTGPFNLYSDVNAFATPFATGITKSTLTAGFNCTTVPDYTTIIRVVSTGVCNTSVDLPITGIPSGSTTTTTSSSSTTSTTTTNAFSCLSGTTTALSTCAGGQSSQFTIAAGYTAKVTPGGYYYSGTGTRYYYAYITDASDGMILYTLTYTQVGSNPGTWTSSIPGGENRLPAGTYNLHLNTISCQGNNGSGTFSLQVGNCQQG